MSQNMSPTREQHSERVERELREVGDIPLGMQHFVNTSLPNMIHQDEHILAAIFGRHKETEGFFGILEGALIATNLRVMFVDHRIGYTTMDEFSYQSVSGVNLSTTLLNATVTLFTRVKRYRLSFVNLDSAQKFSDYIEKKLEGRAGQEEEHKEQKAQKDQESLNQQRQHEELLDIEAIDYLQKHEVGVLSWIDRTGSPRGIALYYTIKDQQLFFIMKEITRKNVNPTDSEFIAFTVYDERTLETIQLSGTVKAVVESQINNDIITSFLGRNTHISGNDLSVASSVDTSNTHAYGIAVSSYSYTKIAAIL